MKRNYKEIGIWKDVTETQWNSWEWQMANRIISETKVSEHDSSDPLHETFDSPVPGLTHRYPDRVLLLVTEQCSMYCRHCTRRRFAGHEDKSLSTSNLLKAIEYIKDHKEVRDVLISGGDALCVSDEKLEFILQKLRNIDHVQVIRIGTRTPVVMPQRITYNLCNIIKKYHPVWVNTHFNHPKEITEESMRACRCWYSIRKSICIIKKYK